MDGDNFQRKCIDYFSPLRQYIGGIILEMKDSVVFAGDSDALRNNSVFNPVYDGSNMGLPSSRVVRWFFSIFSPTSMIISRTFPS